MNITEVSRYAKNQLYSIHKKLTVAYFDMIKGTNLEFVSINEGGLIVDILELKQWKVGDVIRLSNINSSIDATLDCIKTIEGINEKDSFKGALDDIEDVFGHLLYVGSEFSELVN